MSHKLISPTGLEGFLTLSITFRTLEPRTPSRNLVYKYLNTGVECNILSPCNYNSIQFGQCSRSSCWTAADTEPGAGVGGGGGLLVTVHSVLLFLSNAGAKFGVLGFDVCLDFTWWFCVFSLARLPFQYWIWTHMLGKRRRCCIASP